MTPDPERARRPGLLLRLARWLGFGRANMLDAVTQAVVKLQESVIDLSGEYARSSVDAKATLAALQQAIAELERKTSRVGREQFKANVVNEATQQSIKETLARLREVEAQRERELAALRERLGRQQAGERLKVVERLFPVLDGLNESLLSGRRALEQMAVVGADPASTGSLRDRLRAAWGVLAGRTPPAPQGAAAQRETLAAWLTGVEYTHDRLLAVLEQESVRPIEALGRPFDPHWHQVVEVVPTTDGVAPGQVVRQLRRGYVVGDIVLRYAEVIVARDLGSGARASQSPGATLADARAEETQVSEETEQS